MPPPKPKHPLPPDYAEIRYKPPRAEPKRMGGRDMNKVEVVMLFMAFASVPIGLLAMLVAKYLAQP